MDDMHHFIEEQNEKNKEKLSAYKDLQEDLMNNFTSSRILKDVPDILHQDIADFIESKIIILKSNIKK